MKLSQVGVTAEQLQEYTLRAFSSNPGQDVNRIAADFGPSVLSGLITKDLVDEAIHTWGWLQLISLHDWDAAAKHFHAVTWSALDASGLESVVRAIYPGSGTVEEVAGKLYVEALFGNMTLDILEAALRCVVPKADVSGAIEPELLGCLRDRVADVSGGGVAADDVGLVLAASWEAAGLVGEVVGRVGA
jgi:hypothetical protein